jgi:hypothetical protein
MNAKTFELLTNEFLSANLANMSVMTDGGEIRESKGKMTVTIATNIIKYACNVSGKDSSKLDISTDEVIITALEETEVDIVVRYDGEVIAMVESKSYADFTMFKRYAVEVLGLEDTYPKAKFSLFQLENALGGDYDSDLALENLKGSSKVNKLLNMLGLKIDVLTMMNGKRQSQKAIHKENCDKPIDEAKLQRAVKYFVDIFSELS